jgi:hypothetical protein
MLRRRFCTGQCTIAALLPRHTPMVGKFVARLAAVLEACSSHPPRVFSISRNSNHITYLIMVKKKTCGNEAAGQLRR